MEEFDSGFEHEAGYLDPRLGVSGWRSSPLAAHDNPYDFSDCCLAGKFEYDPTQRVAYSTFDNVINEMQDQLPSTRSSHVDTQHEEHQFPAQLQSGPKPVSRYHGPNLVDNETYTEFCGVYSPEKVPLVRKSQRKHSPYHCPRCDGRFTRRAVVKSHFRRCIAKHGNPEALRWNDHVSLKPLREGEPKDKARSDRFRGRLKACSGVMIPSKLPPGGVAVKFVSSVGKGNHLCAICGGGPFSIVHHVKSHFLTCVEKHGNHTGANWFDLLDANHDKNHLSGRPAATANASSAIPSEYGPGMPLGDQLSSPSASTSNTFEYAPAMPQGYQSSLSKEYPPIPLGYNLIMDHEHLPPLAGEYPPIPFGYAPVWPQESQSYAPTEY